MVHTTVGIYPDGTKKVNGVRSESLAYHIWYNITFRPGRALYVDGKCLHNGLKMNISNELYEEITAIKIESDTAPYV